MVDSGLCAGMSTSCILRTGRLTAAVRQRSNKESGLLADGWMDDAEKYYVHGTTHIERWLPVTAPILSTLDALTHNRRRPYQATYSRGHSHNGQRSIEHKAT